MLIAMIQTYLSKIMLRTLQFCLVNIFIHKFFQFFGVYFYRYMLYMTGLSLWDSEHEHNSVNMLCSLKRKIVILQNFLQASP